MLFSRRRPSLAGFASKCEPHGMYLGIPHCEDILWSVPGISWLGKRSFPIDGVSFSTAFKTSWHYEVLEG